MTRPDVEIFMPVHNEGESIEATVREWHGELAPRVDVRFVICEDGSKDDTKDVLRRLAGELPIDLHMADEQLGYGGAVVYGLERSTAPFVLAIDSDGQCAPSDFWAVWERRRDDGVVMGWRHDRRDSVGQKLMSRSFGLLHRTLFGQTVHDPSCPYVLMPRRVIETVIPRMTPLVEAFWWEFTARCKQSGFALAEERIAHRLRAAGDTVVFRPAVIPGIALRNGIGLFRVWRNRG